MGKWNVVQLRCEYKENPVGIDIRIPRISWQIDAGSNRGARQGSYRVQVSLDGSSFDAPLWDTGKINSDRSVHIEYAGPKLESCKRYYYRVMVWDFLGASSSWSEPAFFETGFLSHEEWSGQWIVPTLQKAEAAPASYVRKAFELSGAVKSARVYVSALGLYMLHINGSRAQDDLFTPGWTSYGTRLQYQTYDVTSYLRNGQNALGLIIGDGWYKGSLGWINKRNHFGDRHAALLELHVEYESGRTEKIVTDSSWVSEEGPIRVSELYHGETYDARLELIGWDEAGYEDADWHAVETAEFPMDRLIAQESVPVRITEEIKPIAILKTPAGETVLDMGQNMVGWVRFTVNGAAGDKVVLRHAEVLDKDGYFYVGNLRTAKQQIEYICKGGGIESYEPHFTFQGFRYVLVEQYPGEPVLDAFTGRVIHSDMEVTGSFECSDPLVNKLQQNIVWGQRGNFLDVPTDCPQRDERLGWTGDAQVFIRTAAFNMNVASFFTKWVRDLKADQHADGGVPSVIPIIRGIKQHSSAAWGDAAVICPWTMYLCYGDTRILEEQYDSMKAWVEYIHAQGDQEFLWNTGFHYGDWLALDANEGSYVGSTPRDLIGTAFFAYCAGLLAKTADIIGKPDEAEHYRTLRRNVVEQFRAEYISPNGRMIAPTQTAHVLALMFDLVEGDTRRRIAATLADYVKEKNYHLTTGFVGTPYLCHVLSDNGYHDVAVKLLLQTTYPSWLFSIKQGATTIWEHWDGIKPDGSFWSADMNSYNHYAYGSIGDWMYQRLAGINTDGSKVAYKQIHLRPAPCEGLTYAKASLQSMYGEIRSGWSKAEDGTVTVEVSVPANTTAFLDLPVAKPGMIRENGNQLGKIEGIIGWKACPGGFRVELGSGTYTFEYK
jgi:alpha-L-rhamnosidase